MNVQTLFKTNSHIQQIKNISGLLREVAIQLESLSDGKVDYYGEILENSSHPDKNSSVYDNIELAQGFEAEAYRYLHNAFLYIKELGKL